MMYLPDKVYSFIFRNLGDVIPSMFKYMAYPLWFKTSRRPLSPSMERFLKQAQQQKHEFEEKEFYSYRWGEGKKKVLFVHGWGGSAVDLTSIIKASIKKNFVAVSIDNPSHGQSSGHSTNMPEISRAIDNVSDVYGAFDAVVTHSGGLIPTLMSMQRVLKTKKIVAISPLCQLESYWDNFFTRHYNIGPQLSKHLKQYFEKEYGHDIWVNHTPMNNIQNLVAQGLLIHDTQDPLIPMEDVEELQNVWDGCKLIKTDNLGHDRILLSPKVIRSVIDFIQ